MFYRQWSNGLCGYVHIVGCLFLLLVSISPVALAQKTDVIILNNGDRVTGEIKALERGQLRLSTTAMGTITINWDSVERVISDKSLQLQLASGARLLGSMEEPQRGETLLLNTGFDERELPMNEVVRMEPMKIGQSFWKRLEGSIRFGLDYAKGSRVGQSNLGLTAMLREEKHRISTEFNYNFTRGSQQRDTERYFLGGAFQRNLKDRWFWLVNSSFERNDELGIDGRWLTAGSAGRFIWQTNLSELGLFAGVAASRETRANDANGSQLEGQLGGRFSIYRFYPSKADLNSSLLVYPGITEAGRWRGEFRLQLRWEMIRDLFWDLTYYYSFDNQPPVGASRNDTGVNTSLGYSF